MGISHVSQAADLERIRAMYADTGKVMSLKIAVGMTAVIQLPAPVTHVVVGDERELSASILNTTSNEVAVRLKSDSARPTNLIIRCGKRRVVFDVFPNRLVHQDVTEVVGTFGAPGLLPSGVQFVAPTTLPTDARLIESSRGANP